MGTECIELFEGIKKGVNDFVTFDQSLVRKPKNKTSNNILLLEILMDNLNNNKILLFELGISASNL